ncbi:MAG: hypothetical protein N3G78_02995 [Desulfobacterota bacterium]|nr:hypothetical protein [Thermodesulfobacteriota bacterium]
MERPRDIKKEGNLLELVRGLLNCQAMFQEIFKKYKQGRLRFKDIQGWVDDRGGSPLYTLKEQSHALFRNREKDLWRKKEWLLDLVIGSIFHEAMKLRENVYQLEFYRPKYRNYQRHIGKSAYEKGYFQEFERIISKAGHAVLLGMAEIRSLFSDAMDQLIDLFKVKRHNPYLVRFLVENQPLLHKVYGPRKGRKLFDLVFEGGPAEAYERAGRSYQLGEHHDLASNYFARALKLKSHDHELLFHFYFSKGMDAYFRNLYPKTISIWKKLMADPFRPYLKKPFLRQMEEVCRRMASEWQEDGKPKLAQEALSLAEQIKKMLG